jgi:hypothetical protein
MDKVQDLLVGFVQMYTNLYPPNQSKDRVAPSPLGHTGKHKPQPGLVASDPSVLVLLLPLPALKTFLASLFDRGA